MEVMLYDKDFSGKPIITDIGGLSSDFSYDVRVKFRDIDRKFELIHNAVQNGSPRVHSHSNCERVGPAHRHCST